LMLETELPTFTFTLFRKIWYNKQYD